MGRNLWEVRVAPGWRARQDPECITIEKSEHGALQLSSATKTGGLISQEEFRAIYEPRVIERGGSLCEYSAGQFRGFTSESRREGDHWQEYWLAHGSLLLFVTYNGVPTAWLSEREEVNAMLGSLRVQSSANEEPS